MSDKDNIPEISAVSIPDELRAGEFSDRVLVNGAEIAWDTSSGVCTFRGVPATMMWVDSTLAGLMAGMAAMVGPERFYLALQAESRKSVGSDWLLVDSHADFREGFSALAQNAAVAGWGIWQLQHYAPEQHLCVFRAYNNWEALYQKSLGVCWGSGVLAGKFSGICSRLFQASCWATQTRFAARGDEFDEFEVRLSERSIEDELAKMLSSDEDAHADMVAALVKLREKEAVLRQENEERRKAEEELRVASRYNRSLIEASPDPLVTISPEGKITDVNQATEAVTGCTRNELIGTDFSDYFTEPEKARAGYLKVFQENSVRDYPLCIRHKNGRITEVLYNASVYRDEASKVLGVFAAARDVTERNKVEKQLLENQRHAESLLRLSRSFERAQTYEEVLVPAGDEVRKVIGYQSIWVFLFSADRKYAYPLVASGRMSDDIMQDEATAKLTIEGDPMLEEIAAAEHIVVVEDALTDPRTDKEMVAHLMNRTIINVPIIFMGKHLGSVGTGTFGDEGVRPPTPAEEKFLLALASHMAVTLDRLHLLSERNKVEARLREKERHDLSLLRLSRKLELAQTYGQAVSAAQDEVREVIGYSNLWVYLLSDDKKYFKALAAGGTESDYVMSEEGTATLTIEGDRMLEEISQAKDIVIVEDARTDPRTNKEIVAAMKLRTIVNVPVFSVDRHLGTVGTATLGDEGVRVPSKSEAEYLRSLASHMAVTLDRLHLLAERKRAEAVLQQSEEALKEAQRIAHLGSWSMDLQTNQVYWSEELYRMYGYDPALPPPLYTDSMKLFTPESWERLNTALTRAAETGIPYELELEMISINGAKGWMHARGELVRDAQGKAVRMRGVVMDITKRKQAELELRALNADFVTLLENTGDYIYFKDKDSRIIFCSQTMAEITGHASWRDMVGKHDLEIFPADTARIYYEEELPIFREGKPLLNKTDPYYDEQGGVRWVNTNKWPVFAEDGKTVVGIFGISRDITELKVAEDKISELNRDLERRVAERTAQLEAANKELEAFSYSVSHDLRAPLRAIDGFSRIILDDYGSQLDDEGKRLLNIVRANSIRMAQLIDDILQFSRTGRLEFAFTSVDMDGLAREVADDLKETAPNPKLEIRIGELPPANGDRTMLRQVFVNLLVNAIKFSRAREKPEVEVRAERSGDEIIYAVRDNGAGFDMRYMDKLFGVFQRLHTVEEFEGTGIGLAIVKRIVTRHGGRVWAEGKVNEGATIYFALPAATKGVPLP